ncbi:MAG: MFS transporter [Thiolinea sp.]
MKTEHLVALFSNSAHIITHMATILYATAVLHLPHEFGMNYGEMLGLASVGLILYGVAALPAGWLGDRWSQIGMMTIFFAGVGIATMIVGLAKTATQLYLGLSLIGLFAAIYHPVGIAWLIANTQKQGMTMGINGLCGGIGSAIAAPFVGLMIDYASWRHAFIVPGIISLLIGITMYLSWRSGSIADIKAEKSRQRTPEAHAQRRVFMILTLTMACTGFIYAGITHTMPKLFEQGLNSQLATSYTEVGLYVGFIVLIASLSSLFGGWLADKVSSRTTYITFWFIAILPLFFITRMTDVPLLMLVMTALACISGFAAAENILVARYTPFAWRSLAYGAKFVLALGIGGLTIQLAGRMFDGTGDFSQLYLLLGIAAILAAFSALLLPKEQAA